MYYDNFSIASGGDSTAVYFCTNKALCYLNHKIVSHCQSHVIVEGNDVGSYGDGWVNISVYLFPSEINCGTDVVCIKEPLKLMMTYHTCCRIPLCYKSYANLLGLNYKLNCCHFHK